MSLPVDVRLLELVASRICHDLVGPVGAMTNGLELLQEVEEQDREEIANLLMTSARQAWRRLDFFRAAVGHAGGRTEWAAEDLLRLAAGWVEGGKVTLDWTLDEAWSAAPLPAPIARVLLLLLALATEALARGGTLAVQADGDATRAVRLVARGRGAALQGRVRLALEQRLPPGDMDPRVAPAVLAGTIARGAGLALAMDEAPDRVEITVRTVG